MLGEWKDQSSDILGMETGEKNVRKYTCPTHPILVNIYR